MVVGMKVSVIHDSISFSSFKKKDVKIIYS